MPHLPQKSSEFFPTSEPDACAEGACALQAYAPQAHAEGVYAEGVYAEGAHAEKVTLKGPTNDDTA